ncbi:HNH endonuclease [uncultured Cohaesibacter sp.]|uniref:HNH endonuclease n=1 Tax=uncultured Cohaesibacter sp. TaxID=1002546 RepID=UPI0029C99276|nr:HNH endonuclease [uncultured Cohaesibacter sp.]
MPKAPSTFAAPWAPKRDRVASNKDHDKERRKRHPWRNWYKLVTWKRIREQRLAADPLCVMCLAEGRTTVATVVDHRIPHKGDRELFFSYANTQSLCETHHNRDKQRMEARGEVNTQPPASEPDVYF